MRFLYKEEEKDSKLAKISAGQQAREDVPARGDPTDGDRHHAARPKSRPSTSSIGDPAQTYTTSSSATCSRIYWIKLFIAFRAVPHLTLELILVGRDRCGGSGRLKELKELKDGKNKER